MCSVARCSAPCGLGGEGLLELRANLGRGLAGRERRAGEGKGRGGEGRGGNGCSIKQTCSRVISIMFHLLLGNMQICTCMHVYGGGVEPLITNKCCDSHRLHHMHLTFARCYYSRPGSTTRAVANSWYGSLNLCSSDVAKQQRCKQPNQLSATALLCKYLQGRVGRGGARMRGPAEGVLSIRVRHQPFRATSMQAPIPCTYRHRCPQPTAW